MTTAVIGSVAGTVCLESFSSKLITFTGAAGLGQVGAVPIFTVSGHVAITYIVPLCTVDLVSAGGGSISLGSTSFAASMIAATVATAIDANEFWHFTTPAPGSTPLFTGTSLSAAGGVNYVTSENVIATVTVGDVTAGAIQFYCYWRPLSSGAFLL